MKTPSAPITVAVVCTVLLAALRSGAADGYWDARFGSQGIGGLNAVAVSGSNVYVGSLFTFSAINATNIARWDGTAWSALGGGVNDRVFAIAVKGTDVYAGGKFTQAGGVSANYVARWNGSTWSPLGTSANNGVSGFVYCIVPRADGPGAYVGGIFSTAYQGNGTPVTVNYVAYWNGSAWSALGTGLNSTVYGLCSSGSNLYAGGEFSSAGSVTAAHVAKWNGSGWSALTNLFGRDGVNGYVMSIAVKGTDVFVGGNYTAAAGTSGFNNIARYDTTMPQWRTLGNGVNATTIKMTVQGTNLYAGGYFTMAGGTNANHIARWDGANWSALGSGVNSTVEDVSSGTNQIYVAGGFSTAGGKPSNGIAIWHETPLLRPDLVNTRFSGNDCLLSFVGQVGQQYSIERSPKLVGASWSAFTNFTGLSSGTITIADSGAALNPSNRFYRVRSY